MTDFNGNKVEVEEAAWKLTLRYLYPCVPLLDMLLFAQAAGRKLTDQDRGQLALKRAVQQPHHSVNNGARLQLPQLAAVPVDSRNLSPSSGALGPIQSRPPLSVESAPIGLRWLALQGTYCHLHVTALVPTQAHPFLLGGSAPIRPIEHCKSGPVRASVH